MTKLLRLLLFWLALMGLIVYSCIHALPDGRLHVYVLDVGQGDSILVRSPDDEFILIDGGPNDEVIRQISRVMPFYKRKIDVVILTHPHADHINGLIDVLKRYEVGIVMMTGVSYHSAHYDAFLEQIGSKKIPIIFAGKSDRDYRLGKVILDMVFPFYSLQGKTLENLNNSSIVFRLLFGKNIFYFNGDAEAEEEQEILQESQKLGLDLHADFLKIGHHGSRTSSSSELLAKINPSFAAISCGIDNSFHHPHAITLEHLRKRGVTVYRTDVDGLIEALTDGRKMDMKIWGK